MTALDRAPDPSAYAPAEYTATVVDDETRYVVDLRDCRVWRLAGIGALAWEWVLGAVTSEEAAALLHPDDGDEDAGTHLRPLHECCETLATAGLLTRVETPA
ncbi:hypothetical protein [Microbacterium sp. SLBN-146]|uniref:hypothetical protein n=1 Tax=Microbacterium sp. SLBN-146 TaxID=2768457 RepID=UPI00114FCF6C|nr:hypothetical protein [Microbacterium sp. SLBN-146]TQJ30868.1 hypothetical protein FBY39_1326 [Microbacterium sp. SLBN-146]